jgi:MFS family permease
MGVYTTWNGFPKRYNWKKKIDLSWNDFAGNRNMNNSVVTKYLFWSCCRMSLLGIGTAFVYPALLAAISDIAHPQWRATSLGVYRFRRNLGFLVGALGIGFIADLFSASLAIHVIAWIAIGSGLFVLIVMKETKKNNS